jgi:hypothetical protein
MRISPRYNKGEALLETIIAFIVLAVGVTIAGMILASSLRNMQNAKNRVIAVNLAREGIEAVRNIRDTNWLKFHSKRRACWNNAPDPLPSASCDGMTPIESGRYIIYKQGVSPEGGEPTYRWLFGELTWAGIDKEDSPPVCANADQYYYNNIDTFTYKCDAGKWIDMATLSLVDIDPNIDSNSDHDYENDEDIYNHLYQRADDELGTFIEDSFFTRIITIGYLDNQGKSVADIKNNPDVNRMDVTSTVYWISGGHRFKVELTTHLTDYLGREKLGG